ncbi:hypothetical protein AVEN_221231-1, partial [Araneus ventricosus]
MSLSVVVHKHKAEPTAPLKRLMEELQDAILRPLKSQKAFVKDREVSRSSKLHRHIDLILDTGRKETGSCLVSPLTFDLRSSGDQQVTVTCLPASEIKRGEC